MIRDKRIKHSYKVALVKTLLQEVKNAKMLQKQINLKNALLRNHAMIILRECIVMISALTMLNPVLNGDTVESGLKVVFVMSTVVKGAATMEKVPSCTYVLMILIREKKVHMKFSNKLKIRLIS